ncbi:MAG: 4-vinyl reductase [Candidatus Hermodarchaeia archaeon]|jgi:predicted hydrocarbon binding protein
MIDAELEEQFYYYPNKMGRIILLALEDVIGQNGVNAVLNLADLHHLINNYPPNNFDRDFSFSYLGGIHHALDTMYGQRAGRGLATRTGRAYFKHGLREFGSVLGISNLTFRLLPLKMKLKVSIEAFAELFNSHTDQIIRLEEKPDMFCWHTELCPICWGRVTESPCCHLVVGMLQESLFWVSGGKHFMVEEVNCVARGDPTCSIQIDRHPLD